MKNTISIIAAMVLTSSCAFVNLTSGNISDAITVNSIILDGEHIEGRVTGLVFDTIIVNIGSDMEFEQTDSCTYLEVSADDNLLRHFVYKIVNNKLYLGLDEKIKDVDDIKIRIGNKSLSSLEVNGACDLEIENGLVSELLNIEINGACNMEASSIQAESVLFEINGASEIDIDKLSARSAQFEVNGAGNLELDNITTDCISLDMNGAGNAVLKGSSNEGTFEISGFGNIDLKDFNCPNIKQNISGMGRINK